MNIFIPTLNQMAVLFSLIIIGFLLVKFKVVDEKAATVLSRLENNVFIPALVMSTFINNFTADKISSTWKLLVFSLALVFLTIPLSVLVSKLTTKDKYLQKIFTYGLVFSNFGFMGNAVVEALFPDKLFEYILFTLPMWSMIYLWGAPVLLIADSGKQTIKQKLKSFLNPMFVSIIIGMIIGISGIKLPSFANTVLSSASACMSPLAMILTGITVASVPLKKMFADARVYVISFMRLIVYPIAVCALMYFLPLPDTFKLCAVCATAMPLGLNTIVIPSAYGKDTTAASSMAVVSHIMSCISIPIIFMLMEKIL